MWRAQPRSQATRVPVRVGGPHTPRSVPSACAPEPGRRAAHRVGPGGHPVVGAAPRGDGPDQRLPGSRTATRAPTCCSPCAPPAAPQQRGARPPGVGSSGRPGEVASSPVDRPGHRRAEPAALRSGRRAHRRELGGRGGRRAGPRRAARGPRQLRGDPLAGAARGGRGGGRGRRDRGGRGGGGRGSRGARPRGSAGRRGAGRRAVPGRPAGHGRGLPAAGGHRPLGARRRRRGAAAATGSDRLDEVARGRRRRRGRARCARPPASCPSWPGPGWSTPAGSGVYLVLDSLAGLVSGRRRRRTAGGRTTAGSMPRRCRRRRPTGPTPELRGHVPARRGRAGRGRRAAPAAGRARRLGRGGRRRRRDLVRCTCTPTTSARRSRPGVEVGRPHRITRHPRSPPRPPARPPVRRDRHAVLLVVPGPELAELARCAGAAVLVRAPDGSSTADRWLRRWPAPGAARWCCCPATPGSTAVAEQAAAAARRAGQDVLVMPTAVGAAGTGRAGRARPGAPARRRRRGHGRGRGRHPDRGAGGGRGGGADLGRPLRARRRAGRGRRRGGADRPRPGCRCPVVGSPHAGRRRRAGHRAARRRRAGRSWPRGWSPTCAAPIPEVDVVVHRGGPADCPLELGVE